MLTDIQGYCLICGIDRGTIDKKSKHKKGFPFHVKYEHNQWNYIFYISYLEDKIKSEFFGYESIVSVVIERQEISWFPMNRALSIPGESDQSQVILNIIEGTTIIEGRTKQETKFDGGKNRHVNTTMPMS